jgi:DNA polymerase-3 subunit gamma/tau
MAELVLYRKWRPQALEEIAGQEHVVQTLKNALATGRIAHAYLFCGPRGTGKTSTGRILAKAINCLTTGGHGEPCNACQMCIAFNEGRALDLIEIDAASNRRIDDVRELREKVRFAPVQARTKVYIIDEVHMLTTEAFNALLKTLEEPPPTAVFVLATTDPHELPATIISRCQRFDFRRLTLAAMVDRLATICQQEGFTASQEVLRTIARSAGGSLRDAINVLEQMTVSFGPRLELEPVRTLLGFSSDARAREIAKHILKGDAPAGLKALGRAVEDGVDLRQFHRELMEFLRGVLLAKTGAENVLDTTQELLQEMKATAASTPADHILKALRLLGQAAPGSEGTLAEGHPTLMLEMAVVECSLPSETGRIPPRTAEAGLGHPPQAGGTPHHSVPPSDFKSRRTAPEPPRSTPGPTSSLAAPAPSSSIPIASGLRAGVDGQDAAALPLVAVAPEEAPHVLQDVKGRWRQIVEACKGKGQRFKFDGLLRSAEPVAVEGDFLVLGFAFPFHLDRANDELENPVSRRSVEDTVARTLGRRLRLRCILTPKPRREPSPAPSAEQPSNTKSPQEVGGGHLLKAALEMGAKVVEEE